MRRAKSGETLMEARDSSSSSTTDARSAATAAGSAPHLTHHAPTRWACSGCKTVQNLTDKLQEYLVQRSLDRLDTSQSELMAWYLESIEDEIGSSEYFFDKVRLIMLITDRLIELGILKVIKQSPDEDQYNQIVEWCFMGLQGPP